LFLLNS
jgi:hypothetical protein